MIIAALTETDGMLLEGGIDGKTGQSHFGFRE
jgi:hypothetical protein